MEKILEIEEKQSYFTQFRHVEMSSIMEFQDK